MVFIAPSRTHRLSHIVSLVAVAFTVAVAMAGGVV